MKRPKKPDLPAEMPIEDRVLLVLLYRLDDDTRAEGDKIGAMRTAHALASAVAIAKDEFS